MSKKLGLFILLGALYLSGCQSDDAEHIMHATDNKMDNPVILAEDAELRKGDLDVEKVLPSNINSSSHTETAPPPGTSQNLFLSTRSNELHQPQVNPAIKPKNGNYANNVISFGLHFLETPYEYGSDRDDPRTFDCSDFTRYAYLGALGLELPMDSRSQARYVQAVGTDTYTDLSQARPGDLLFFMSYEGWREEDYDGINPMSERISHVGIYMGDGKMVHTASKKTGGVRIDEVADSHLEWRFVRGGRVLP
ncbi:C40 family peptidase [Marinicrinis sediminis]|uniref:C40 family peptidase n=1 Tax=Marinicrinis sediminis TaxID=1652465 RepID=A0ABW5R9R6_9BACL